MQEFSISIHEYDEPLLSSETEIREFAKSDIFRDLQKCFGREFSKKIINLMTTKEHNDVIADQAESSILLDFSTDGLITLLLGHKELDKQEAENE